LIALNAVTDNDHLMIITHHGIMIRMAIEELRVMGRATQGVRLINLRDNDEIAAVTNVENGNEDNEDNEADNPDVVDVEPADPAKDKSQTSDEGEEDDQNNES
jgi:DNA gyrase subunit A